MKVIGATMKDTSGTVLPLSAGRDCDDLVFLSGQLGLADGKLAGPDIETQTNAAVDNIERLLEQAGLGLRHVFKTNVWLTRPEDFATFNRAYGARFAEPYPARSTVVSQLLIPGALVEIEAIAKRG